MTAPMLLDGPMNGAAIYVAGATWPVRRMLLVHGVKPPVARFRGTLADAPAAARNKVKPSEPVSEPLPA